MRTRLRRHPVLLGALALVAVLALVWAYQLVRLQRNVDTYADHWAKPQGRTGGLLYVALGDSVAQGIGASSPDKGYVTLLAQRMREATGAPVEIVNLSSSGARIADVLDVQLPALAALGRRPDIVTVDVGGNDVRDGDLTSFNGKADRLTAGLPAGSYVADVPYFMHGRWERDAQQAADQLRRSSAAAGLRPIPLHEALREQGWQAMFTQFAADWFHPNDRGHRVWADAFWQQVRNDPALSRVAVEVRP